MKAITNTGPGRLELQSWPKPKPGAGQARIRTAACGICSTDLQMIAGWQRTGFPSIPGHEWAGIVDAVGAGVDPKLAGRHCVAENVLADGGEVGFEHPGGYAEYLLTEARNLHLLPGDFPLQEAVLIEPLAVAVRGLRRLRVEDRSRALILGDGPIGLLMLLLLRQAGVEQAVLVGGRPERLRLAQELGASQALNYHDWPGDLAAAIAESCPQPFPNIIEASGSATASEAVLRLAARGAHVLIIGDYGDGRAAFPWNHLLHQEIELIGSNASAGAWPEAVELAAARRLPLGRLVTHRLPAERFAEGVELVRSRQRGAIKVVLEWPAT